MPSSLSLAGILADYTFDEGSGSTVHDRSGNGMDATIPGSNAPTWTPAGLRFSGSQGLAIPAPLADVKGVIAVVNPPRPNDDFMPFFGGTTSVSPWQFWFRSVAGLYSNSGYSFQGYPAAAIGTASVGDGAFLIPGIPSLVAWMVPDGSPHRLYAEGQESYRYGYRGNGDGSIGARTGSLAIGTNGYGFPIPSPGLVVSRLVVLSSVPSPEDLAAANDQIEADCQARGVTLMLPNPTTRNILIGEGDSIMWGANASPATSSWARLLPGQLDEPWDFFNFAVAGQGAAAADDVFASGRRARLYGAAKNAVVVHIGTNDLAGATSNNPAVANTFARLQSIVAKHRNAGADVVVAPMLSRANSEGAKGAYNAMIAGMGTDHVHVVPASSWPNLVPDGSQGNSTYFDGDGIHPLNPGHAEMAAGFAPIIDAIDSAPEPTLDVTPATANAGSGTSTVTITATLANSSATLSASVSGGGTLSTNAPVSGAGFTWTKPGSGSGTATVTVTDGTRSDTCVITYAANPVVATSFTLAGPSSGVVGVASSAFTITPNASYTGTITITPSGGGLSTPIVLTFSGSATPQTFTVTPTQAGTVTLTPSNNGGLANPSALAYAAATPASPGLTLQDLRDELDARGLTASWGSKVLAWARWGVNRKRRVALTETTARYDLYADDGTTIQATQAVSNDGAGNETIGART